MPTRTFFALRPADGTTDLFTSDGTPGGTSQVAVSGAAPGGVQPANLTLAGSTLLFTGVDAAGLSSLFSYNTSTGAAAEVNVPAAAHSSGLSPSNLTVAGSTVLFSGLDGSGYSLFTFNTITGATADLAVPDAARSGVTPTNLTVVGSRVLFGGQDTNGTYSVFAYDTATGFATRVAVTGLSTLNRRLSAFTVDGSVALFTATDAAGQTALFSYDATTGAAAELSVPGAYTNGGFNPYGFTVAGTRILFGGDSQLNEHDTFPAKLFSYDTVTGMAAPVAVTGGNNLYFNPTSFYATGSTVLFRGADTADHQNLFGYNATTNTAALVSTTGASSTNFAPSGFTAVGAGVLFMGNDSAGHQSLFRYDTASGTAAAVAVAAAGSAGLQPSGISATGSGAVFGGIDANGRHSLFSYDGTTGATAEIIPVNAYPTGLNPRSITSNGAVATFYGLDSAGFYGVWQTDGTAAGTVELEAPNRPQLPLLEPLGMTAVGSAVLFSGLDTSSNRDLFRFDSATGAAAPVPLPAGATVQSPAGFAVDGPTVLFKAHDKPDSIAFDTSNFELFSYNTTTGAVAEVSVTGGDATRLDPGGITAAGSVLVFSGRDSAGKLGLFSYSTATGTAAEVGVAGGGGGGVFQPPGTVLAANFAVAGSTVLFTGVDLGGYISLFSYDTVSGVAGEVAVSGGGGAAGVYPANLTVAGSSVLFSGTDMAGHQGLFRYDTTTGTAAAVPVTGASTGGLKPANFTVAGSTVEFTGTDSSGQTSLFSYSAATGTAAKVAVPGASATFFMPSNLVTTGSTVEFTGYNSAGTYQLFSFNAGTGTAAPVSNTNLSYNRLFVDGSLVLFDGYNARGTEFLYTYNTGTGTVTQVSGTGAIGSPLTPVAVDGSTVLFKTSTDLFAYNTTTGTASQVAVTGQGKSTRLFPANFTVAGPNVLFDGADGSTDINGNNYDSLFSYSTVTGTATEVQPVDGQDNLSTFPVAYGATTPTAALALSVPNVATPSPYPAGTRYGTETLTGTLTPAPGASAAGRTVTLAANGQALATTAPVATDAGGRFTATFNLPAEAFTLTATAQDGAGNAASTTATVSGHADALLFGQATTDPDSFAGQVYALYGAVLNRTPDGSGLQSSLAALGAGLAPAALAQTLLGSTEFTAAHGPAAAIAPGDFVNLLYQDALHRAPDPAGQAQFVAQLQGGTSQAQVAATIALSPESIGDLAPAFQAIGGVFSLDEDDANTARLFYSLLGRAPDAGGLSFFEGAAASGGTLHDVATGIMQSPEFLQASANLSDTRFVQLLYQNELGRNPDPGGQQTYTSDLAQGASRAEVAVTFATSAEARQHLAPLIEAGYRID